MNALHNPQGFSTPTRLQSAVDARDWECKDADTRALTHGIHRYSGKFIPQIARQAIELLTQPGEVVLDPYCGSGTTLLEAILLGRQAVGIDLNPLATLIAKVKCTPVAPSRLDQLFSQMEQMVKSLRQLKEHLPLFDKPLILHQAAATDIDERTQNPWYRKWFPEEGLQQLTLLNQAIMRIEDDELKSIALVAFSDILRRCSHANQTYPNVMYDKRRQPRPMPAPLYSSRLKEITQLLKGLWGLSGIATGLKISTQSAADTRLENGSVDAIVTHPPYIGSIPYAEYCQLSLMWLGHDPGQVDKQLTGGKRQARDVLERFQSGYLGMFQEAYRVLKPGRHIFLLVGNPLVKGNRIDLSAISCQFANQVGFQLVASTGRTGMNRRANKMGDENLLFFRKATDEIRSGPKLI